jgi:glutathione S-transferase
MLLVGRFQSPFVRRTGIVLKTLGMRFDTKGLTTANDTAEISTYNPVGRVPSLVLDDGEVLVDSQAIIDYALEVADRDHRLLAASGPDRRAVLRLSVIAQGAMEKAVASYYERGRRPKDKVYQDWVDRVDGQCASALAALDAAAASGQWLYGDHLTLAEINATAAFDFISRAVPYLMKDNAYPALAALAARCNELPAFAETRPKD